MTIRIKVYDRMAERRLQQNEVAAATGIRASTVGAYQHETVKQMKPEHLDKFCKLFNCKIEDIIEYIPDKPEK